jgi:hypothetical protein
MKDEMYKAIIKKVKNLNQKEMDEKTMKAFIKEINPQSLCEEINIVYNELLQTGVYVVCKEKEAKR